MYLPELLPKFIALFEGAARRDGYEQASRLLAPQQRACFGCCTGGPINCKQPSCHFLSSSCSLTCALFFQVEAQDDLFPGKFSLPQHGHLPLGGCHCFGADTGPLSLGMSTAFAQIGPVKI